LALNNQIALNLAQAYEQIKRKENGLLREEHGCSAFCLAKSSGGPKRTDFEPVWRNYWRVVKLEWHL